MSRLIDADKLIEVLNKNSIFRTVTNAEGKNAIEIIEEQPTAFDVDKVVEQLEIEKYRLHCLKNDCIALSDKEVYGIENRVYNKAIEIVEAGGIDE